MSFKEQLAEKTAAVQDIIYQYLPEETGFSARLAQAMNYSMKAGGKRLRPLLIQEAYLLFGGKGRAAEPFMAALEMIHTHSLIHDDLPALDNDCFRRGKETTHVVFGEALGILSGDALLNYAYETAFCAFSMTEDALLVGQALQILSAKTGIYGMLGGQSVDVMNEQKQRTCRTEAPDQEPLAGPQLDYIYQKKTAALLEAALMIGAVLAKASPEETEVMEQVGHYVGMAFQIQDDILDVTSTTQILGKPVFSDEKNQKATYVTIKGLPNARQEVAHMTGEALKLLELLPRKNEFLTQLITFLISREK